MKLCSTEENSGLTHRDRTLLEFDSPFEAAISVREYIDRISTYLHCTFECYVLAFALLERLEISSSVKLSPFNIHRFMLISTRVASKYLDDKHYQNKYYAKIGGIAVDEFNYLELAFVYALSFRLYVNEDEFGRMYSCLWSTRSIFHPSRQALIAEYKNPVFYQDRPWQPKNAHEHCHSAQPQLETSYKKMSSAGLREIREQRHLGVLPHVLCATVSDRHLVVGRRVGTVTRFLSMSGTTRNNATRNNRPAAAPEVPGSRCLRRSRSMGEIAQPAHHQSEKDLRRSRSLGTCDAGEQLAATANSVAAAVFEDLDSDDLMFEEIISPISSPSSVQGLRLLDQTSFSKRMRFQSHHDHSMVAI